MSASSSASKWPDLARNNGARCLRLIDTIIGVPAPHRCSNCFGFVWGGQDVTPGALIGAVALSEICVRVSAQKGCVAACQARRDRSHHVRRERKKGLWLKLNCHNPTLFNQASETRVQYEARSKYFDKSASTTSV